MFKLSPEQEATLAKIRRGGTCCTCGKSAEQLYNRQCFKCYDNDEDNVLAADINDWEEQHQPGDRRPDHLPFAPRLPD